MTEDEVYRLTLAFAAEVLTAGPPNNTSREVAMGIARGAGFVIGAGAASFDALAEAQDAFIRAAAGAFFGGGKP